MKAETHEALETQSPGRDSGSRRRIRVLIVEDNPDDAALMVMELRRTGFEVDSTVVSSAKALDESLKSTPDVVLADYHVPGIDAPELLRRLALDDSLVPVIVLSGAVDETVIAQTIKAGAVDYLLKDRMLRLGPAVTNALREAELERERARLEANRARIAMRMHAVVEHLTDAVFVVGARLQIESANHAGMAMFGLTPSALLPSAGDLLKDPRGESVSPDFGRDETIPRWSEACALRMDGSRFAAEWCFTAIGPDYGVMVVRDITHRKAAMSALKARSLRDPLTKLPNRALFADRLAHAVADSKRSGTRRSLMLVDLDGFKEVNDQFGHMAGDTVLRVIAYRLEGCLRASDTVARIGGDEFAILLSGDTSAEDSGKVAAKIHESVCRMIRSKGIAVHVGASIGVAVYPANGTTPDSLMREADAAMYFAKRRGGGVHHAELTRTAQWTHSLAHRATTAANRSAPEMNGHV